RRCRSRACRRAPRLLRRVLDVPRAEPSDGRAHRAARSRRHSRAAAGIVGCSLPRVEPRVIAYKFLEAGGVSPFAAFQWPVGASAGVGGYVGDVQRHLASGRVPLAAFAAARAAEVAGGPVEYERERARQAAWLADRLGLGTG